jgi:thymidylate synthase
MGFMNNIDKKYQELLQDILDNGTPKSDRTGTGTISVFGRQIRHNMKDGFPLLTTKKMPWKTIVTELIWFLRGDTNIKYLVDNNCHIWDGDCYSNYVKTSEPTLDGKYLSQPEFIHWIKTDDEFAKKWGELGPIYGKQWRRWSGASYIPHPKKDETTEQQWHRMGHNSVANKEIDQISELIKQIKKNPDSRRLMVNAWAVHDLSNMVLPPCHYGFQVYTRELSLEERLPKKIKLKGYGDEIEFSLTDKREIKYYGKTKESNESLERVEKLKNNEVFYQTEFGWGVFFNTDTFETVSYDGTEWGGQKLNIPTRAISLMWNQRSCDFPLGIPFNIASYGLLLEIIAKEVNMVPDELIGNLGDCHIYLNQIEGCKEQIGRDLTLDERFELWDNKDNQQYLDIYNNLSSDSHRHILLSAEYYGIVKRRTREPYRLPTLKFSEWYENANEEKHSENVFNDWVQSLKPEDFIIENYQSHPTIKYPLSN